MGTDRGHTQTPTTDTDEHWQHITMYTKLLLQSHSIMLHILQQSVRGQNLSNKLALSKAGKETLFATFLG